MTPIYDVLSAHPVIGAGKNKISFQKAKLAMAVRGSTNHYLIHQIQRRHWISQGQQAGISAERIDQLIEEVIDQTDRVIDNAARLLPREFPTDLADTIFEGMRKQCRRLSEAD